MVYPSCSEILILLSSFLTTSLWEPYYFYFYFSFSGFLPLAVRSPWKVLCVFWEFWKVVVVWHVPHVPWTIIADFHVACAVLFPFPLLLYLHMLGWVTGLATVSSALYHGSCCWLLLWVNSSSGGAKLWFSCASVQMKVTPHSFLKKNHILFNIVNMVPRGPWILYASRHLWIHPANFLSFKTELATAAKSLQSCPTLCDPIDGCPPGSPIPGILKAKTLEWVAISFSDAWKWKVKEKSLSRVQLLATPWTVAHQAPPSMGFSRQEYWSGVPLPSPIEALKTHNLHLFLCLGEIL